MIRVDASDSAGKTTEALVRGGASILGPPNPALNTTLVDGNYRLDIAAEQVKLASGGLATKAIDFAFGGQTSADDPSDDFFRLYGGVTINFTDIASALPPNFGSPRP